MQGKTETSLTRSLFRENLLPVADRRKLEQAGAGQFCGEGVTKAGEKFYLKMESITSENAEKWERYFRLAARYMMSGWPGMGFYYLANNIHVQQDEAGNNTYSFKSSPHETYDPKADYTAEEFNQLVNLLGEKGFTKDSDKTFLLVQCSGALSASYQETGAYVVYAAKTPDFTIMSCPDGCYDRMSIKSYIEDYGDLLMSVTSNFKGIYDNKDFFGQVGISRNPWSIIAGDYKGISMDLHSFTGAVVARFFETKSKMRIWSPLPAMKSILKRELTEEEMSTSGNNISILVSSLAARYYNAYQPSVVAVDAEIRPEEAPLLLTNGPA
ncbi:MAG: hypothetical protein K0U37_03125 [Gammaproteobacteria bacterium]|nr:hypothetical protein [Gammaproteobacteria bacterium]